MKKPVHSDGDDQVSDNENSQAKTEYEPNITTKQRENTQSNVGHALSTVCSIRTRMYD